LYVKIYIVVIREYSAFVGVTLVHCLQKHGNEKHLRLGRDLKRLIDKAETGLFNV